MYASEIAVRVKERKMLDKNSPITLKDQLEKIIRDNIENEVWAPGTAIISENQLSKEYGVSRMTVRLVITKLVQEGLLYRVQGKGTFVMKQKISATPLPHAGIREQLESMGYTIKTKLLFHNMVIPGNKVAKALGIPPEMEIQSIVRVRYIKEEPFSIHRSYIHPDYTMDVSDEELETEQLCHLFQQIYNIVPTKVEETLELVNCRENECFMLNVEEGSPLLMLVDIMKNNSDNYEYSEVLFKGDMIKLTFSYDIEK
jgi:GntR family transcriptional regulator